MKRPGILVALALSAVAAAGGHAGAQPATAVPKPGPVRPVRFPTPAEKTLPNGLRVVVVPRPGTGLAAAQLLVRSGGESDPKDRDGLADFTANLLVRGTLAGAGRPGRSNQELALAIEQLGATLRSRAGWDHSSVSMEVLAGKLGEALPLLADAALRPAFPAGELERLRRERADELAIAMREPSRIARWVAARVLFGSGSYGHPLSGTAESVARIGRADVAGFHRAHWRPDRAILVVAGDVLPEDVFRLAARDLGGWRKPPAVDRPAQPGRPAQPPSTKRRIVFVDLPSAGQAAVVVVRPGISRRDPEYVRALVANAVLSGYSGRLNQEIRIRRGLSYGARSSFEPLRATGPFTAATQTKNESAAEVASVILAELERLAAGDLREAELEPRRASLLGDRARDLETVAGLADEFGALALHGLPWSDISGFFAAANRVSPKEVRDFARRRLAPGEASLVVVGDGKLAGPAIREKFGEFEVVRVSDLDLGKPGLRK